MYISVYTYLNKLYCGGYFMEEEESKQINKTLNDLSVKIDNKIEELTKSIDKTLGEKQEYAEGKISENPLAYMAGAFVGGVIIGYMMGRGKN
jgi:capsular polysaccharide biosynthesis protein